MRIAKAAPPFGRITGADFRKLKSGKKKRKSSVNKSGNYTKPALRKRIFNRILAANIQRAQKYGLSLENGWGIR